MKSFYMQMNGKYIARKGISQKSPIILKKTSGLAEKNRDGEAILNTSYLASDRERNPILYKSITCDSSIYIMDQPKLFVSNQKEETISA